MVKQRQHHTIEQAQGNQEQNTRMREAVDISIFTTVGGKMVKDPNSYPESTDRSR